eukprot:tig00020572_g11576.t1
MGSGHGTAAFSAPSPPPTGHDGGVASSWRPETPLPRISPSFRRTDALRELRPRSLPVRPRRPRIRFAYAQPFNLAEPAAARVLEASTPKRPQEVVQSAREVVSGGGEQKAPEDCGHDLDLQKGRLKLVGPRQLVQQARSNDDSSSSGDSEAAFVRTRLREMREAARRNRYGYGYGYGGVDDEVVDLNDESFAYRYGIGALRSRRKRSHALAAVLERRPPPAGYEDEREFLVDDDVTFEAYLARESMRVKMIGVKSADGLGSLSLVSEDEDEAGTEAAPRPAPRLISVEEASHRLGVPPEEVCARLESGALEGVMCVGAKEAVWFAWEDSVHEAALGAMRDEACGPEALECSLETAADGIALTLDEAAERLGIHRDTLFRLVQSGEVPASRRRLGGRGRPAWRVRPDDLLAFQERRGRELDSLVPLRAVAARLGRGTGTLARWVKEGLVRGEKRSGRGGVGGWIREEDAQTLAQMSVQEGGGDEDQGGYLTVRGAASLLGVRASAVHSMIAHGELEAEQYPPAAPGAEIQAPPAFRRRRREWRVPRSAVEQLRGQRGAQGARPGAASRPRALDERSSGEGTVSLGRAAEALEMSRTGLRQAIHEGSVPAVKVWSERCGMEVWRVPASALPPARRPRPRPRPLSRGE